MDLKEALKVILEEEHIGDFIYNVRERAVQDPSYKGDSWHHPRVKRYGDAVARLTEELKKC